MVVATIFVNHYLRLSRINDLFRLFEQGGNISIIIRKKCDVFSRRFVEAFLVIVPDSKPFLRFEILDTWIVEPLNNLPRVVRRPTIRNNDLKTIKRLRKHALDRQR